MGGELHRVQKERRAKALQAAGFLTTDPKYHFLAIHSNNRQDVQKQWNNGLKKNSKNSKLL